MFGNSLFADDRAVSPVIGTALMLAISVALTAAAGSVVFGLDDRVTNPGPEADFDFEFTDRPDGHDTLTISYREGDTLAGETLDVVVTGLGNESGTEAAHESNHFSYDRVEVGDTTTVDASDSTGSGNLDLNGATVKVVWTSPDTGRSDVLATWSGLDA